MSRVKVMSNTGKFAMDADPLDICNTRYAVDNSMYKVEGVQWFISALTGERVRRQALDQSIRFELHIAVGYAPTDDTSYDFLYKTLIDAGLNVDDASFGNKGPQQLEKICKFFKDHANPVVATAIQDSARKWAHLGQPNADGDIDLNDLGLSLTSLRYVRFSSL